MKVMDTLKAVAAPMAVMATSVVAFGYGVSKFKEGWDEANAPAEEAVEAEAPAAEESLADAVDAEEAEAE